MEIGNVAKDCPECVFIHFLQVASQEANVQGTEYHQRGVDRSISKVDRKVRGKKKTAVNARNKQGTWR